MMKMLRETVTCRSTGMRPTFHDVTEQVRDIVARSGITDGFVLVCTHHTTCSVMIQECSFDLTYNGLEYLQQDLTDVLEEIIPTCRREGQYMHPGPQLTEFSRRHGEEKPQTLNTDAHLRSALIGRSEVFPVIGGRPDLGSFGHVYLVDFDQTCARTREVTVQVTGE